MQAVAEKVKTSFRFKLSYCKSVFSQGWIYDWKKMKTKICALCQKEEICLYRVKIAKGKVWIFVCTECCNKAKSEPNYRYGGTWKGDRH